LARDKRITILPQIFADVRRSKSSDRKSVTKGNLLAKAVAEYNSAETPEIRNAITERMAWPAASGKAAEQILPSLLTRTFPIPSLRSVTGPHVHPITRKNQRPRVLGTPATRARDALSE